MRATLCVRRIAAARGGWPAGPALCFARPLCRAFAATPAAFSADPAQAPFRVAVVGTGPGGFYTAKYLLKEDPSVHVDLLDALPTPFGLVRSGVAPDHPEVKSVQNDFEQVASDPRVKFLGNVRIGSDVQVEELQKLYHAVVLAYGAASDRHLGVPGEALNNVVSARAFVNWYNGHPDFRNFKPNLEAADVVIIGQGNVAIDCARILTKTITELSSTDIATHALEALSKSKVRRVHVVGRRGHVQAAFTMKELREVTKLEDADFVVRPAELAAGRTAASLEEAEEHRAKKRMDALLAETAAAPLHGRSRQLHLRFLLAPRAILPDASKGDGTSVGAVEFDVTRLEGPPNAQRAVPSGKTEVIPAGMVLRSVGYKSIKVPGIPWDEQRAVVRNERGRVVNADGSAFGGVYVSGWLKRGPSGIIGTNIPCARETVASIVEDRGAGRLTHVQPPAEPLEAVRSLVAARGRDPTHLISWADFRAIDAAEVQRGASSGKPREKFTSVEELLEEVKRTKAQAAA